MDEIKRLVRGKGECYATNKITQDNQKVGFMYREESEFQADSGWRFIAGTEDDEYLDNPSNMNIYDVNVIANYDEAIIQYLDLPVGSELERIDDNTFEIIEA